LDDSQRTDAAIELTGIQVRFSMPSERIVSFKEYVLKRISGKIEHRELWALRSLDLMVRPGEIVGVVGRNGAGKSTLLKVISRVLTPTGGRVVIRGQVAPLLELGAGFHFDLTGRENVFLNAALFGYSSRVVQRNLDEVIAFSELGEFIDLPIRNYSSGMMARLGFAVATMFRPDILLIDELLAVGDVGFQDKCLKRIHDFRSQGTAILLVSHQLEPVSRHCDRTLWIERGILKAEGPTDEVLQLYSEGFAET
jgi:ABC-2 type transport system ATP-binding protein/lipopolysaccharide transport system ATP-binding protein